ncbi:hypothetical protein RRG08_057757 [Elysia crispata]|uniref:Uncharacterized protein n=1 Tax=Elysia crispata TaxID=231223 RepID=A0AAE0YHW6_9GAST|nr:hypothetical protein RRG08_057757 [Elysia crispata]
MITLKLKQFDRVTQGVSFVMLPTEKSKFFILRYSYPVFFKGVRCQNICGYFEEGSPISLTCIIFKVQNNWGFVTATDPAITLTPQDTKLPICMIPAQTETM